MAVGLAGGEQAWLGEGQGSAGPIYSCLCMGTHAKRSPEGEM